MAAMLAGLLGSTVLPTVMEASGLNHNIQSLFGNLNSILGGGRNKRINFHKRPSSKCHHRLMGYIGSKSFAKGITSPIINGPGMGQHKTIILKAKELKKNRNSIKKNRKGKGVLSGSNLPSGAVA